MYLDDLGPASRGSQTAQKIDVGGALLLIAGRLAGIGQRLAAHLDGRHEQTQLGGEKLNPGQRPSIA